MYPNRNEGQGALIVEGQVANCTYCGRFANCKRQDGVLLCGACRNNPKVKNSIATLDRTRNKFRGLMDDD